MVEYKFTKREAVCAVSGEPFVPGDLIISAIYFERDESGEHFVRRDLHERHFADPTEAFCFWRTKQPEPEPPAHKLDFNLALEFLDKLVREADPTRERLAYTLALLLARKRRVKLKSTRKLPECDLIEVVLPGEEEDKTVQMRAPQMDDAEIDRLQTELADLFGLPEMKPAEALSEPTEEPTEEPAPEAADG